MHPAVSHLIRQPSAATFPRGEGLHFLISPRNKASNNNFSFRPCGPLSPKGGEALLHGPPFPGMPPASRASRPRTRGYAACKDLQSTIVHAHQLKDLFHRLRGPPSPGMPPASRASRPCAGLRRLQGLVVEFCSCPLSMDLFRPFGAPSPCAGTAGGLCRWRPLWGSCQRS